MTEDIKSKIVDAAEKLVKCKGRYHAELNYKALAELFGVTVPTVETESKWIKCSDRLPDDFQDVICCNDGVSVMPATHYGDGEFWVYHEGAYEDKVNIAFPSHWMPLPNPPEVE